MRAYSEIAALRERKKGEDLLDQLLWRIKILGGQVDLTRQLFTANYIYPPPLGGEILNSGTAQLNADEAPKQIEAIIGRLKGR